MLNKMNNYICKSGFGVMLFFLFFIFEYEKKIDEMFMDLR